MIKIENVTKTFDGFVALDNFSLEVEKGCAYGLLGSNGAGKSTLLRLLAGIYRQDSGRIMIDDEIVYDTPATKQKIFYISDDTSQFSNMTLTDMKKFTKTFYPTFSEEVFNKLWDVIKLPLNKKLYTFSKGMRRQAAVICGISACTEYLFLDEAFDGLDPTMRIVIKKMLVDSMLDYNTTIMISSHNLDEIEEFCDVVGLLHKGKTVFSRELDSLKGNVSKIQTSLPVDITADMLPDFEIMHISKYGSVTTIIAKGNPEMLQQKLFSLGAQFADRLPLTLKEIFVYELEGQGYDFN